MLKLLKKIDFKWILLALFYVFIFFLLLRNSFNYLDPDFGWHLKVGEEIVRSGSMPSLNHYNYVFTGSWVDHEWLSNVLVYEIYNHVGYLALSAIFALLIVLVLILLNLEARRLFPRVSLGFVVILEMIGLAACLPHLGIRIQEIGLLFTVILLIIINRYNQRPSNWWFLWLPFLFYLWASLHASFLLGLGLAAAWWSIKILEKFLLRVYPQPWLDLSAVLSGRAIFSWVGILILSGAATLLTPYHFRLYSFLSSYQDNFYRTHLQEWLSQFSFPLAYGQLAYLALVVLFLFLYIYYSRGRCKVWSLNLWSLFLVFFFVYLSFLSRRHFPLLFISTFLFLVTVYSGLWPSPSLDGKSKLNFYLKIYLLIALCLVSVSQIMQTKFTGHPFRAFCDDYPCAATDFLQSKPEYNARRLFNYYTWGGYLIWTWPERSLFIDGRLPQVMLGRRSYLAEYYEFFRADSNFASRLRQYDIRLVLLPAREEDLTASWWEKFFFMINDQELIAHNYLRDYLQAAADWERIYIDQAAVIYAKKN